MKRAKPLTAAQFARRYAAVNADLRATIQREPRKVAPAPDMDRHSERALATQIYRQQGGP